MQELLSKIDKARLPRHIAIIMDGNGRWAKEQGQDRLFGHFHGVESVRDIVEGCAEMGIEYLTLYAFSTENWDRPQYEVVGLMELLVKTIRGEAESLHKNNIRLHVIGDFKMLPDYAQRELQEALDLTAGNTGLNLIMALSYSGRWELLNAVKSIAYAVKKGQLDVADIGQETLQQAALGQEQLTATATSHLYLTRAREQAQVGVVYTAAYRIGGGAFLPIDGAVVGDAPPVPVLVVAERTVLTNGSDGG